MLKYGKDGSEKDAHVHPKTHVPRVPDIQFEALFPSEGIATMSLRITGKPRTDIVPMVLLLIVTWKISHQ